MISTPFCSHSVRSIFPISALICPYITCRRYFGANTIWYWHLHFECDKLCMSSFMTCFLLCFLDAVCRPALIITKEEALYLKILLPPAELVVFCPKGTKKFGIEAAFLAKGASDAELFFVLQDHQMPGLFRCLSVPFKYLSGRVDICLCRLDTCLGCPDDSLGDRVRKPAEAVGLKCRLGRIV